MNLPIKIDRARYWGLTNPSVAFYGSLAANLQDIADPSIETAATDGNSIRWNPDFVNKLTDEEVRFVLFHETLHCAHDHFHRLPLNDEGNEAGDYAINATLEKVPGIKMPEGGLRDQRFDAMAEEEILAELRKRKNKPQGNGQQPGNGKGKGQPSGGGQQPGQGQTQPKADPGGCGGFTAPAPQVAPKGSTTPPPSLKEKWERAIVQADMAAKSLGRGDTPADLQRLLDRIKAEQEVDWRQETHDFVKSATGARNDWTRSCRRMATAPVIYPRRKHDNVGLVVFVRDTSGSVSDALTAEFTAHISTCTADIGCEALVMDCDTQIHAEYRLGAGEEAPLQAKGGGGTDFRAPFARVQELIEQGERVAGLVYLTDLDGTEPDEVDLAVLWLATNGNVARTGRTVRIKV